MLPPRANGQPRRVAGSSFPTTMIMEAPLGILAIRLAPPGGNVVARFDAELDNGVRLYDLKLVRARSGWRVYGPQHFGGAAVTFPRSVADQLANEAVAHVEPAA